MSFPARLGGGTTLNEGARELNICILHTSLPGLNHRTSYLCIACAVPECSPYSELSGIGQPNAQQCLLHSSWEY